MGGFDLWMATLDANGNVGTLQNMGANINTQYDEQAASYHPASSTFVFSSNGRVGMGGYDFFYSNGTIDNLSAPKNFGYPVNSIKDDIYFTSRGTARNVLEDVIISSDRDAACCLEMFSLNKKKPLKQLTGLVIDCATREPIAGAKIVVTDTVNNVILLDKFTDAAGNYSYTMEEFSGMRATGSITGYFNNSVRFVGPGDKSEVTYTNPVICLNRIPEKPIKV